MQIEGAKVIVQNEVAGHRLFGLEAVIKTVEADVALLDFDISKGPETVPLKMLAPMADSNSKPP